MIDGKQIGLNSWGPGDCDPRFPTVLTSVPFYHDWIADQCPECIYDIDENATWAEEGQYGQDGLDGVIGENMMFDMDRVVMFQDGASGHSEAVSVRDLVFLSLEILGVLMISVVAMTLVYRRYTIEGKDDAESDSVLFGKGERKPLLNAITV